MHDASLKYYDGLLKKTSRSFYLTLQALPTQLRHPISLAYLIARSTDTIADELNLPAQEKLALLSKIKEHLQSRTVCQLNLAINENDKPEYLLLAKFATLLEFLYQLDKSSQHDIVEVLTQIITGQQMDVSLFNTKDNTEKLHFMPTSEDLDQYTFFVAGSVGEFWTKICLRFINNYSDLPSEELYPLGIAFGKGLQLVNILRDLPNDFKQGRCYLPKDEIIKMGLTPETLQNNMASLSLIVQWWTKKAEQHLEDGWQYTISLNHRRIRAALCLPLLLGFATLNKLKKENYLQMHKRVKVKKWYVRCLSVVAISTMISKGWTKRVSEIFR